MPTNQVTYEIDKFLKRLPKLIQVLESLNRSTIKDLITN